MQQSDIDHQVEAWRDGRWQPTGTVDAGDELVVFVRITGAGRASGAPVDTELIHVWTVRDGLAVRVRAFFDRDQALAAAGLG